MGQFLFHYTPVAPTTWAYLSSLLMMGLFFKFNRFWSVRNMDIVLLILLAPGLLLEHFGTEMESTATLDASIERLSVAENVIQSALPIGTASNSSVPAEVASKRAPLNAANSGLTTNGTLSLPNSGNESDLASADASKANSPQPDSNLNVAVPPQASEPLTQSDITRQYARHVRFMAYIWLFSVTGLLLLRALLDPGMVRRPLLEPNLSTGGLTFLGCSLLVFLMANVITGSPTADDLRGPRSAAKLLKAETTNDDEENVDERGPGNAFLHLLPIIPTIPLKHESEMASQDIENVTKAKTMAILSHLAVVIGIVAIGYRHFANIKMGIGAAALYLMLPYTAQMTGRVSHALPAALLVWAILCYRRPLTAGLFIGMAIGVTYYPIFLLPLWISFYWQRGLARFLSGVGSMLGFNAFLLIFRSSNVIEFWRNFRGMLGIWSPKLDGLDGIWGLGWSPQYRIPVLTAFALLSVSFAIWPARKNLGTLLSCTSAVMIATQFWHGFGGGLYMAWYLPSLILTIFRPNLEDRVALTVLGEGWLQRRRRTLVSKTDRIPPSPSLV